MLLVCTAQAASKGHVVAFGKWQSVKWIIGNSDEHAVELQVRGLLVDGKLKEYTVGQPHEVTERVFVVRRAFRINDALPGDGLNTSQWRWQRGGWLAVDRTSGRITTVPLPLLDQYYSGGSWYRDYVAYCGVSDDGKKVYAVVAQLGRRKPLLRKYVGVSQSSGTPDSACAVPQWERKPARVRFEIPGADSLTYALGARTTDTLLEGDGDDTSE
jgi:hypothetical protein